MYGWLTVLVTVAVVALLALGSGRLRLVVRAWLKPADLKRRSDLLERNERWRKTSEPLGRRRRHVGLGKHAAPRRLGRVARSSPDRSDKLGRNVTTEWRLAGVIAPAR